MPPQGKRNMFEGLFKRKEVISGFITSSELDARAKEFLELARESVGLSLDSEGFLPKQRDLMMTRLAAFSADEELKSYLEPYRGLKSRPRGGDDSLRYEAARWLFAPKEESNPSAE